MRNFIPIHPMEAVRSKMSSMDKYTPPGLRGHDRVDLLISAALSFFLLCPASPRIFSEEAAKLSPGQTISVKLDSLPPCLVEMKSGVKTEAFMTATLPEDYSADKKFPVLLFLNGGEGGNGAGNGQSLFFTEGKGFVALSLPLYKKKLNTSGIDIYINSGDFKHIAEAYETAFGLLRKEIPNLSDSGWVVGGFSNGAHSIGGILKDNKIKKLFKYFIFVEGGSEIGSLPGGSEAILFIGEKSIYGEGFTISKTGKTRGFPSQFSELDKKNVKFVPMLGFGHEFPEKHKEEAREWLKEKLEKQKTKEVKK